MNIYLDTSVLVSVYTPEARSRRALDRLAAADALFLSRLAEVEFCSALALKIRTRDLSRRDAEKILALFKRHVERQVYSRLHLTSAVYDLGQTLLTQFTTPLRTLDALHLACSAHVNATLLTADRALALSAKRLEIPCELL